MNKFNVKMETPEDVERLVCLLTMNGYEVKAKPVYETEEDLEKQDRAHNRRIYRSTRPRIKYYTVEIVGTVEKPVYSSEETF